MLRKTCQLLFTSALLFGCQSQGPPTQLDPLLGERIDALFAEGDASGPGHAVMVVQDGVVTHAKGYGIADMETGQPILRTTPFRLASVTKQFTCMAILQLAEEGRLLIDDPASKYLPTLERFGPDVTIRRLMQHTSGLPEYYNELERLKYVIPQADDDPLLTALDATAIYENWGEPMFEPGERYSYSNPGYEQLGLIVEAVTGQSFDEYMTESIVQPAGMPTARMRARPETDIPNRAVGYRRSRSGDVTELDDHAGNWMMGAGGLYASLDDLYFWDRALVEDTLVAREWKVQGYQPTPLSDGKLSSYGFGWGIDKRDGRQLVSHGGAWVGFRTHISRYIEDRVTIVVLSNLANSDPGSLSREISKLVFAE